MKCTYYGYLFLLSNLCCAAFGFEDTSTIYVITATVPNQLQLPRLIRLGNTLNLIENLYWIIVSGSPLRAEVKDYLQRLKTPVVQVVDTQGSVDAFLNTAIKWVYENTHMKGFITFCSTDLVFDLEFFKEIRYTEMLSVWTVGNAIKKYQVVFSAEYLFSAGYPKFGENNQTIPTYLSTLDPYNSTDIEFYDDTEEILLWRNPFKAQGRAKKTKWTGYENTNMDALDVQIY